MESFQAMSLFIRSNTWSRDSHGLYDYECQSKVVQDMQVTSSCGLVREETSVRPQLNGEEESLVNIERLGESFELSSRRSEDMWLVIKHLESSSCLLQQGDILKLGRVRIKVAELVSEEDMMTQDSSEGDFAHESGQCRVCLSEEHSDENPLVTPCSCIGSVKHIHLECLQTWLESRKAVRESENALSFCWKSLNCELCKVPYPMKIAAAGKHHNLLPKDKISSPYVVLEVSSQNGTAVHIISLFNQYSVKLGRGHDSDIRISDISVSRVHASIHYREGNFFLEDHNSKFGSLLKVESAQVSKEDASVCLQIGRSVLTMKVGEYLP